MRGLGGVLICISVIAFLGAFAMETAVASELGNRVYHIGPVRKQQNAFLMAVGFYFGGAVLVLAGMRRSNSRPARALVAVKACAFCAQTVRIEALVCRFCRKWLTR